MWRRVNVISVEKVREEREVGQVWPPAAAGAALRSWHRLRLDRSLEPLPVPTPVPHKRKGERMEDGEVGRYMLKKGGRDRPTNLENLQLSIGRSRYVVVGPRRSFGSLFYLLHGMPNFTFYL